MSLLNIPQSTQLVLRPGIIELNWGQPDPDLLPVEMMERAASAVLRQMGPEALSYGAAAGAGPLMAWIRDRIRQIEGQAVSLDEIVITAGNSDAVDQICTLLTQPGDTVLVESPTYHLALRIMNDHPLQLQPVPVDENGLVVAALKARLADLRRDGRRARLLYTIPTFHNPTGVNLSPERRRALVEVAVDEGFAIVEDDVYRELAYDGPAPASLWSLAPRGTVLRMGSFAKTLAPGLRVGWLNGSPEQMLRIADSGLRDSGGGVNHFAAMVVGELCQSGGYEVQLEVFRSEYRRRRDSLLGSLGRHLPAGCSNTNPGGGFFVWVTLPEAASAAALVAKAETLGVSYLSGERFCLGGGGHNQLRLAFSLYKAEQLRSAGSALGRAIQDSI